MILFLRLDIGSNHVNILINISEVEHTATTESGDLRSQKGKNITYEGERKQLC